MCYELTAERAESLQRRMAGSLRATGIGAGDRVAIVIDTPRPEWVALVGACLRTAITPVMVSPALTSYERDELLDVAEPTLVVDSFEDVVSMTHGPAAEIAQWPLCRPMHFTSGTSGVSKGVWSDALTDAEAETLWREEIDQWDLSSADGHLVCSPLHHSAPLRLALSTLLAGGRIIVPPHFKVGRAVATIGRSGVTTTFVAPAHLQRFAVARELERLSRLRLVLHAGSPCPVELKRRSIEAIGRARLWEFYGSTEGQFTVCSSDDWLAHPGTVGTARAGRSIEIRDGVVWCAPPRHARWEYWRDPSKTERAWDGDWFTVGDLGSMKDGYLYLVGRRDDLIISGGVNVYPLEVEHAIGEFAGVEDVVVFPRDDEHWGQRVCAAFVGRVDLKELQQFLAVRLAVYKRPKEYHHVRSIPRSDLDKVRRTAMAASLGLSSTNLSSTEGSHEDS